MMLYVEDKWSAFKDIDFSVPATSAAPIASETTDQSGSTWGSTGSTGWATSNSLSTDLWSSQPAVTTSGSNQNSLWGTTSSTDAFADKSWGNPTPSESAWAKPSAEPTKKTTALLPPPKKKETALGNTEVSTPSQSMVGQLPARASPVKTQPSTRKVEIYEVQYDFAARNADELDLVMEEKVKVSFGF